MKLDPSPCDSACPRAFDRAMFGLPCCRSIRDDDDDDGLAGVPVMGGPLLVLSGGAAELVPA